MPFNIERFRNNISAGSYLQNNKFKVIITPPRIFNNMQLNNLGTPTTMSDVLRFHQFRIDAVSAPGIALSTADNLNRYGIGPTQKFPVNAGMQDIQLSILSDGYGYSWQFWHNWINAIFGFTGEVNTRVGNSSSKLPTYQLEYKDQYSTTMQIIIYDNFGNAIQRIDLFEAFPSSFREVKLGWSDTSQLIRLGVGISYTDYSLVGSTVESQVSQIPNNIVRNRFERSQTTAF